jgi:uncharacterized membrane protein YccC
MGDRCPDWSEAGEPWRVPCTVQTNVVTITRQLRHHIAGVAEVVAPRPSYAAGLRGAIATVLPIAVGAAMGWRSASWMGLAAFCVSTADKGGAYRTRAGAMAGVALFGALSAVGGSLAGASPWTAVILMVLWATVCSAFRIYGPAAVSIGTNSIVMFIVSLASPCSPSLALDRAGAILIGAGWAMLLSLALWPIRLYRPARIAIAAAFDAIAAYAADVARLAASAERRPEEWSVLFDRDYGTTYEAIDAARVVLASIRRGRQTESRRGERLLVLLEYADRSFARLSSLAELLEEGRATIDPAVFLRLSAACERIARNIESERNDPITEVVVDERPPRDQAELLLGELVRAIDTASATAIGVNDEHARGIFDPAENERDRLAPLVAIFTWKSIVFRHALRVGVAAGAAVWLTQILDLKRGYWVTFSAFIILQPYTSATLRKGLQRIAGTLVGGILAAVGAALVHSTAGLMALIFLCAVISLSLLPVNYGLYAVFMTPTFVLLAEVGAGDWHLVGVRIINTVIGCFLGFLAARLLWPSSERALVRDEIGSAVASVAEYGRIVIGGDDVRTIQARRAAHRALQNAEAALQQALSESAESSGTLEWAMALVVLGRRLALAISALAVSTRGRRAEIATVMKVLTDGLDELASAVRLKRSAEPLDMKGIAPVEPAARPLFRQFEAMQEAATRSL